MSYLYYRIQKNITFALVICFLLKIVSYYFYLLLSALWIASLLLWSFSLELIIASLLCLLITDSCNFIISNIIYKKSLTIKQTFSQNELNYLKNELEDKIKQLTSFAKWSCSVLAACMTLSSNLFITITPEQLKDTIIQQSLQHINLDNIIQNAGSVVFFITGTILAYYFILQCFNIRKQLILTLVNISLLSNN